MVTIIDSHALNKALAVRTYSISCFRDINVACFRASASSGAVLNSAVRGYGAHVLLAERSTPSLFFVLQRGTPPNTPSHPPKLCSKNLPIVPIVQPSVSTSWDTTSTIFVPRQHVPCTLSLFCVGVSLDNMWLIYTCSVVHEQIRCKY